MKKVLLVFGTRPEAIKMAPIVKALKNDARFHTYVCVTSQHRQMLDQVLSIFDIKPDFDLDIMTPNQTLFDVTSKILLKIKTIFEKTEPDVVLVQGDTTTAFSTALAAYYQKVKIAHVEAGLRTYDKYNPFPEEIYRKLISSLADFHFAPTEVSKNNLLRENIPAKKIFVTGNSAIDALIMTKQKLETKTIKSTILDELKLKDKKYILVTAHRRESFGIKFEKICMALKSIVKNNKNLHLVYPVHLNPNVQDPVNKILSKTPRIHLISPQDYVSFVSLMDSAYLILTDSGGIQEEAPSLGKPTLVLRDTTERVEAIAAGTAILIGTSPETIIKQTNKLLNEKSEYQKFSNIENPYGRGDTSKKIVEILSHHI